MNSEIDWYMVFLYILLGGLLNLVMYCSDKRILINSKLFNIDKIQIEIGLALLGKRFLSSDVLTLELLDKLNTMIRDLYYLEKIIDENEKTKKIIEKGIKSRIVMSNELRSIILDIDNKSKTPEIYSDVILKWYNIQKYTGMRLY